MGTITGTNIFDRVAIIANDTGTVKRWPTTTELLLWLNDGQRGIVALKPESYSATEALKLAAGIKQELPAAGILLLDVPSNMGLDGTTPGRGVSLIQRKTIDDTIPDWRAATAAARVEHWIYDPQTNQKVFYVYPPSPGTNYLEIVISKLPADVATVAAAITLDDIYEPALLNYVLYRAYSKDADYMTNAARAQDFWNKFLQLLGRQDLMEAAFNPHLRELEKVQRTMQQAAGR